jgi:type I restriction enzyme M protein
VILLPENLFYNTSAAGVIVILNKRKPASRNGKVVLLNASKRFTKGKPKNHIAEADVELLAKAFQAGSEVDGELRLVSNDDIKDADYNLSPSRWVAQAADTDHRTIKEIVADLLELDERARHVDSVLADLLVKL